MTFILALVALASLLAGGACTEAEAPSLDSKTTGVKEVTTAAKATGAPPAPTDAGQALTKASDLFPAAPARDAVLNSCGSCHNLACSAIGQRTSARWDSLKESHVDKVSGIDLDATFAYLKTHFNDARPEPKVAPELLKGGCTPF
jgi:hypothetical protein